MRFVKVGKKGETTYASNKVYEDEDFKSAHPHGIVLESDVYRALVRTVDADATFLSEVNSMDYSVLLGILKVDANFAAHNRINMADVNARHM